MTHPLDRPVWSALSGRQLALSLGDGSARRFAPDIGPLAAAPLFALHIGGPFAAAALLIIPALYMASEVRRYVRMRA